MRDVTLDAIEARHRRRPSDAETHALMYSSIVHLGRMLRVSLEEATVIFYRILKASSPP